MIKLKLEAKNEMERQIKDYLEENASLVLADVIDNGVIIEKDGKKFVNKKTLSDFNKYATNKAREQAEKGATGAFVKNETVYGWAMHFFQENSILGTLYNLDGTVYKEEKPAYKPINATIQPKPQPPKEPSLFDLLTEEPKEKEPEKEEEITDEELDEVVEELVKEETKKPVSPIYQRYMNVQKKYPDSVITYRLGDFYEIFGKQAIAVAEKLDLTLTGRDCGLPERVPMVGFPYHISDVYIRKLIESGYKVAVVENLDDIKIHVPNEDEIIDDDLTEAEMREFDYVPAEKKKWLSEDTFADEDGVVHESDSLEREQRLAKAFDKVALAILYEIFDDLITLG